MESNVLMKNNPENTRVKSKATVQDNSQYSGYSFSVTSTNDERSKRSKIDIDEIIINKCCFWFPILHYELWSIYFSIGFFVLWIVFLFLITFYLLLSIFLFRQSFLMDNNRKNMIDWINNEDLFPFQDNNTVFKIEVLVDRLLYLSSDIFYREGVIIAIMSFIIFLVHSHGFFSFYYQHDLNMFIYSAGLILLFVILKCQSYSYLFYGNRVLDEVFLRTFNFKIKPFCKICWPKFNNNVKKLYNLTVNDYLFKFSACLLNCCQLKISSGVYIHNVKVNSPPLICCKSFLDIAQNNASDIYLPNEIRCVKNLINVTYSNYTAPICKTLDLLPPCFDQFKENENYKSVQHFFDVLSINLEIFGYYCLFFAIICILFLLEKYLTRSIILKRLNEKLQNFDQ